MNGQFLYEPIMINLKYVSIDANGILSLQNLSSSDEYDQFWAISFIGDHKKFTSKVYKYVIYEFEIETIRSKIPNFRFI